MGVLVDHGRLDEARAHVGVGCAGGEGAQGVGTLGDPDALEGALDPLDFCKRVDLVEEPLAHVLPVLLGELILEPTV